MLSEHMIGYNMCKSYFVPFTNKENDTFEIYLPILINDHNNPL